MRAPKLHLFCGLIASGKSTLAQKIADERSAMLLAEDTWLSRLWPGELKTIEDYSTRSRRLKSVLWPYVRELLERDVTVVLDFPANTRAQRKGFLDLMTRGGSDHVLHHLDTPAEVCRERLAVRNAAGAHPFAPTLEDFELFARHYQPPAEDEGFNVRTWRLEPDSPGGPVG